MYDNLFKLFFNIFHFYKYRATEYRKEDKNLKPKETQTLSQKKGKKNMKKNYYYVEFAKKDLKIAIQCYDAICERIETYDSKFTFGKEYRWNIINNQIKPSCIYKSIFTPYWDIIGNMMETKILLGFLKCQKYTPKFIGILCVFKVLTCVSRLLHTDSASQ